jgi:hypothetical protein
LFASLEKLFMERNNLSKEEVHTYIDAIMYEPTNHMPVVVDSVTECSGFIVRLYLFNCPTSLPRYLEQYSIDESSFKLNNIFAGPPTLICKDIAQRTHVFLAQEGHEASHNCKEIVCQYCRVFIGDNIFCLACLATETIVPAHGSIGSKTILEMQAELKDVAILFQHISTLIQII